MKKAVTIVDAAESRCNDNNRNSSITVNKQKEADLEMWKRRAKYDPMKAAAEDKKKKEEAKRLAQGGRSFNER